MRVLSKTVRRAESIIPAQKRASVKPPMNVSSTACKPCQATIVNDVEAKPCDCGRRLVASSASRLKPNAAQRHSSEAINAIAKLLRAPLLSARSAIHSAPALASHASAAAAERDHSGKSKPSGGNAVVDTVHR